MRHDKGIHSHGATMSGVAIVNTKRFADARGWFSETYNHRRLSSLGIDVNFVQDNHSMSAAAGTIRGLHFQTPPFAQAKLVRCTRGAIFDVVVDIRQGSPTYGQWRGYELSADNGLQLFVPIGFAHGFMTLEDWTEIQYKVSEFYEPHSDSGLRWDDPTISIRWPTPEGASPVLSEKDTGHQLLSAFTSPFVYDGIPLPDQL